MPPGNQPPRKVPVPRPPLPITLAHPTTFATPGSTLACLRILPCWKIGLCAVQPGHFPRRGLRTDSRLQIHFADGRRLLPLHDQNRAVIGLGPAMRFEPCSAEERQWSGHGKLRLASVLLDALLESSQEALPILAIAVHHAASFHSHGHPGQRETQMWDTDSTLARPGFLVH